MIRDITLNVGREIDRTLYRDFSGGIQDDHSIDFPATFMECAINAYANAEERIVNNHGILTHHKPIVKEFREIEEIISVKNGLVRFMDFDDVNNIKTPVHRYCMACGRRINPTDRFLAVASHKRIDYKDYCNRCQNYLDRSSKIFKTLTKKNEVHTDDGQARKSVDSYFALCDKMLDILDQTDPHIVLPEISYFIADIYNRVETWTVSTNNSWDYPYYTNHYETSNSYTFLVPITTTQSDVDNTYWYLTT